MTINLKDTLKRLRFEKGITQDELAEHIGISSQAVSKWERGESYPDITLLPTIALYFNTTIDELLDVAEVRRKEKIGEYAKQSHKLRNQGEVVKNYELWESAYAEFPNDEEVISNRMYALYAITNLKSDKEKSETYVRKTIEMGKRLLSSTDARKRSSAIQILTLINIRIGNKEKAKEYANMAANYYVTSNQLLIHALEGDEAVNRCQMNIMTLADIMVQNVKVMCNKGEFSPEKAIECHKFCLDLVKLIYRDGDFGFYSCRMGEHSRLLALNYAKLGHADKALAALRDSVSFTVMFDNAPDSRYTSPLVDRQEYHKADTSKNYTGNDCKLLKDFLENSVFDFIRETEEFKAIEADLRTYV